jgi:hypothetical protein
MIEADGPVSERNDRSPRTTVVWAIALDSISFVARRGLRDGEFPTGLRAILPGV